MAEGSTLRSVSPRLLAAQRRKKPSGGMSGADKFRTGAGIAGTAIGTAIGAFYANPQAGAAIGSEVGRGVGNAGGSLIEGKPEEAAKGLALDAAGAAPAFLAERFMDKPPASPGPPSGNALRNARAVAPPKPSGSSFRTVD